MAEKVMHNFTEEQKKKILAVDHCMREAYLETIFEFIAEGKAVLKKDRFGRLICVILPEKP